jgi:radical SAM family uncharacterized protein/radical SAM-linked protein
MAYSLINNIMVKDQYMPTNKYVQTINQGDVLNHIDHASHYIGGEINQSRKDHDKVELKIALAFPDAYEIGMSHFGIQILYHILNKRHEVAAERVFSPSVELERLLRSSGAPLVSLESQLPLGSFDVIGFSLLYELNYTNVLQILDLAGIPFQASQRNEQHPLIIAGGPCCFNPEPIATVFDAMVIGDGEKAVVEICDAWLEGRRHQNLSRKQLLQKLCQITGVYIPSFYKVDMDKDRIVAIRRQSNAPPSIKRALISDLEKTAFPERPIVPFGKPVHDRLRIEVSRGCSRSCRFCQAGMIYRPVRERSAKNLLHLTKNALNNTGYEDISLLSLSTGDHSQLETLIHDLIACHQDPPVAVSLPSIRADRLNKKIMKMIKKVRKTGFTIAPEAGSQRLRNIINKNITEEDILKAVEGAFGLGWRIIKLYFMIGLPGETAADLNAIVELVKKIKAHCQKMRFKGQINVSVSTFVPKPHTPFQWERQIDFEHSREIIFGLKRKLNMPGVRFKWQFPQISRLEGLWSRGDRRLFPLLLSAYQKGCRFDGWSDHFDDQKWIRSMQEKNIQFEQYLRPRSLNEILPWSHIDARINTEFLIEERRRALNQEPTEDCRDGNCQNCGICDFEKTYPRIYQKETGYEQGPTDLKTHDNTVDKENQRLFRKVQAKFIKVGKAKFYGHLEVVQLFSRAVRRLGIGVQYTQGFHPKAKIVFQDALPVGIESLCERMTISVDVRTRLPKTKNALNGTLPKGIRIVALKYDPKRKADESVQTTTYLVINKTAEFDPTRVQRFDEANKFEVKKTGKKGKIKEIDLKQSVLKIEVLDPHKIKMAVVSNKDAIVRPSFVLANIFKFNRDDIQKTRIIKIKTDSSDLGRSKGKNVS